MTTICQRNTDLDSADDIVVCSDIVKVGKKFNQTVGRKTVAVTVNPGVHLNGD